MFYCDVKMGKIYRYTTDKKEVKKLAYSNVLETELEPILTGEGVYIIPEAPEPEAPEYVKNRMKAYPSYGEQMDMIYKDMRDGTHIYVDLITEIKERFPKNKS